MITHRLLKQLLFADEMEPNSRAAFSYRWGKLQEAAGDRPLPPLSMDEHIAYWQVAQEIVSVINLRLWLLWSYSFRTSANS